MPGSSLWLMPPSGSKIEDVLSSLITKTIPGHIPELETTPHFPPHLTLTSDVPESITENDPQEWLDNLSLSIDDIPSVSFQSLDVGQQFFRKLTLSVPKAPLQNLAARVRAVAVEKGNEAAAKRWVEETYAPHVSLLYADIEIDESKRRRVLHDVVDAGIRLANEGFLGPSKAEDYDGWNSGRIVLVHTWKELKDWTVVAERSL